MNYIKLVGTYGSWLADMQAKQAKERTESLQAAISVTQGRDFALWVARQNFAESIKSLSATQAKYGTVTVQYR